MFPQHAQEAAGIPVLRRAPLHFGQGEHARQQHIFQVLWRGDVLRPEVGLDAEDVVRVFRGDAFERIQ